MRTAATDAITRAMAVRETGRVATQRQIRMRRAWASGLLIVVILAGLVTHGVLPDTAGSDIAGDALYALAIYLLLVILAPRWSPLVVGALAAGWCIAIELFQLTGIPLQVGSVFPPAALVLGSGFDARDLVVYVIAVALAVAVDVIQRRRRPTP